MPSLPGEAGRCRAGRGGRPVAVKMGLLQLTFGDPVFGSEIGIRMSKESVSGQEHIRISFHLSGSLTQDEGHAGKWKDRRPRFLSPAM